MEPKITLKSFKGQKVILKVINFQEKLTVVNIFLFAPRYLGEEHEKFSGFGEGNLDLFLGNNLAGNY